MTAKPANLSDNKQKESLTYCLKKKISACYPKNQECLLSIDKNLMDQINSSCFEGLNIKFPNLFQLQVFNLIDV